MLLRQFASPLVYILLLAGCVAALLGQYKDSGVILVVLAINAALGFSQELKAERNIRALGRLVVPLARVLRSGVESTVDSAELVPGDVVRLASGDRVPADLRLLSCNALVVEEAMLTGESVPARKHPQALEGASLTPGDQLNMAFMGTIVLSGRAEGVVTATGADTLLGGIAGQTQGVAAIQTPLLERMERFAHRLGMFALAFCAALVVVGLAMDMKPVELFMIAIAMAVAIIPEGLPIVVTITLAIGVQRMARRNAIIRRLPAVETLGSATVICTDKTGTLTRNEMTVRRIWVPGAELEVTGTGYSPQGSLLLHGQPAALADVPGLEETLGIGLLCNESSLVEQAGLYRVSGDPTEGALIVSARKAGLDEALQARRLPLAATLPFESERGYMATLHRTATGSLLLVKGGHDRLLELCASDADPARPCPAAEANRVAEAWAGQGLRVLAMGLKELPGGPVPEQIDERALAGLRLAGMQGIIDPPREESAAAVAGCARAGIRTVMITGDHAVTAKAIASSIGIGGPDPEVLTGRELTAMSDEQLRDAVGRVGVYARVAPEHKLRITRQLIARGQLVAMTGDGVNDAPALRAAHIGIAMGASGTDVAREASDMILADDNFATIFAAVEEGRVVYENIRKVTLYLTAGGFGVLCCIVASVLAGLPLPLSATQILWFNFVTSALMDVSLAFEPGEPDILDRPPRAPGEGLLDPLLLRRILLTGALMAACAMWEFQNIYGQLLDAGQAEPLALAKARTATLCLLAFFQFFHAFSCRSLSRSVLAMNPLGNKALFVALALGAGLQFAVVFLPALEWVVDTEALTASEFLGAFALASCVLLLSEADKLLARTRRKAVRQA